MSIKRLGQRRELATVQRRKVCVFDGRAEAVLEWVRQHPVFPSWPQHLGHPSWR